MNKLKRGAVREDGKVFHSYVSSGSEWWITPEKYAALKEKNKIKQRELQTAWTPEQRKQRNQLLQRYFATIAPEQRDRYNQRQCKRRAERAPEQREHWKQYQQKYKKHNRESIYANEHRRRARKLAQLHPELDRAKEEAIHAQCIHLTHTTGVLHHVDHIIPLSCGGWHHHDNLQCLPAKLNIQKHDNPVWEHHGYKCWRDVPTHLWPEQLDKFYSSLLV